MILTNYFHKILFNVSLYDIVIRMIASIATSHHPHAFRVFEVVSLKVWRGHDHCKRGHRVGEDERDDEENRLVSVIRSVAARVFHREETGQLAR